jgi:hypothetical protein
LLPSGSPASNLGRPGFRAQWRITDLCASKYVRTSKEVSTTGDRKRADPIACRLDRGTTEAAPKHWRGVCPSLEEPIA